MKLLFPRPLLALLLSIAVFSGVTRTTLLHVADHEHVILFAEGHGVSHIVLSHAVEFNAVAQEGSNLSHGAHDHDFHVSDLTAVLQQRASQDRPAPSASSDSPSLLLLSIAFDFAYSFECDVGTWSKPQYVLRI